MELCHDWIVKSNLCHLLGGVWGTKSVPSNLFTSTSSSSVFCDISSPITWACFSVNVKAQQRYLSRLSFFNWDWKNSIRAFLFPRNLLQFLPATSYLTFHVSKYIYCFYCNQKLVVYWALVNVFLLLSSSMDKFQSPWCCKDFIYSRKNNHLINHHHKQILVISSQGNIMKIMVVLMVIGIRYNFRY